MNFPKIDKLCNIPEAFHFSENTDAVFLEAMKENFRFQYEQHAYFRYLCRKAGFSNDGLQHYDDIFRIPPLFVGTMKIHAFTSVPKEDITMVLTSSGTTGQKTQSFFDRSSFERLNILATHVFKGMGLNSEIPVHQFVFNYDRKKATDVGTAWSSEQLVRLAPVKALHWTILWNDRKQEYEFDLEKWVDEVASVPENEVLRFIGFPAFIYQLVVRLKEKHPEFRVNPACFVLAGGGWKNHSGEVLSHQSFASFLNEAIGFSPENIRDTYGMAEHGVPFTACCKGYHHMPIYSRLVVREPLTCKSLPFGKEGLLQLYTPFNTAQLNLSILSTDICVLATGCECGMPGIFIASVRRGGIRKQKGCAIAAQEILNKS
ncbi:MAG: acyl-protein synthetase LuxE [Bacteroidetes bacterium]|nr:acyl-protein synthetase LuxE [Bacteroidota bacterium]